MNLKEYISSGILELYSAGLLSETESKEVEVFIRNYPEVRNEYDSIQKSIYIAASQNLLTPSPQIKQSVFNKIGKQDTVKPDYGGKISQASEHSGNFRFYKYMMAASIAFLLLSLGSNFMLWKKLKDANNEIAVLTEQKKTVVQEYESVNRKLGVAANDMEILRDRNYKVTEMKGLEISPGSNAVAFWNPETKKVYIEVLSLPAAPEGKQYQLWGLSNGKPIDAGVMDVNPSDKSLHPMKSMDDVQAFAITLEPKGGSVNPTMDQMYVMGEI